MTDHYTALGVPKTATAAEIKQAFRKLASQHHPDKGGDTAKFQAIQAAYAVLGEEQKRAEYDNPRAQMHRSGFGSTGPNFNFDDIFSMFGTSFADNMQQRSARLHLWISLYDVAVGGARVVAVGTRQGQHTAEINIPPGIEDGDTVRYAGAGAGNSDLVITFKIKPEPGWQRQGNNLVTEIQASIWDLILGAQLQINNISGNALTVTLPARTQPGTLLRLRGHGLPNKHNQGKGDMLLKINATLPDHIPDNLVELIQQTRQL